MKKFLFLLIPLVLTACGNKPKDTPIAFSLFASKANLKVDENIDLKISLKDQKDSSRAKFTYASSNEDVLKPISFTNNVITLSAMGIGNVSVIVTETTYNTSHSVDFKITDIDKIILNQSVLNLTSGNTFKLTADVDDIAWTIASESIATVSDQGLVTAVSEGNTTITATYTKKPSITAKCSVYVYNSYVPSKTTIKQNYNDFGKNSLFTNVAYTPITGDINLLIIPVWFNDSSNYIINDKKKQNVHDDIKAAYLGENSEVGYRSVRTYYEEESSEKLHINGLVTDWYDTKANSSMYSSESTDMSALLKKAVNWAKESESLDLTNYDNDKNGFIDGVVMIYARPDFISKGETENNFWAYCGQNQTQVGLVTNPVAGPYFWASYDFMYEKNASYTIERTGTRYGYGHTYRQIIDTETFIHEMGHMFGLDDYYDYTYELIPGGRYTMQDENVSTHDPFSYIALNWADPYIPTQSCKITIGDFATSHDVILLTPEWNSYGSAFDEYILLELYSLTGLNEMYKEKFHDVILPNAVGIRVWHVDARLIAFEVSSTELIDHFPTNNVNDYDAVYSLAGNTHKCIFETFPKEQSGSFLCENQNLLQLISHTPGRNYGAMEMDIEKANHFIASDLFTEGDTFTLDEYKKQFLYINMNKLDDPKSGQFYTSSDTDIRLNNRKKLNWSFTVSDITTVDGASTATITLTKSA